MNCRIPGEPASRRWFLFDYEDPMGILAHIGKKIGIDFGQQVRTPDELKKLFGAMKKKS